MFYKNYYVINFLLIWFKIIVCSEYHHIIDLIKYLHNICTYVLTLQAGEFVCLNTYNSETTITI